MDVTRIPLDGGVGDCEFLGFDVEANVHVLVVLIHQLPKRRQPLLPIKHEQHMVVLHLAFLP
jgi:hypothetical protein